MSPLQLDSRWYLGIINKAADEVSKKEGSSLGLAGIHFLKTVVSAPLQPAGLGADLACLQTCGAQARLQVVCMSNLVQGCERSDLAARCLTLMLSCHSLRASRWTLTRRAALAVLDRCRPTI